MFWWQDSQNKEMERTWRIAKEMSHLIIYCRSVAFNMERIRQKGFIYTEMSSFPETKAEKLICQQENKFFLKYHQVILFLIVLFENFEDLKQFLQTR